MNFPGFPSGELASRDLFDNAIVALSMTRADGSYIAVNAAYARLFGYETPEALVSAVPRASELYVDRTDRDRLIAAVEREGFVRDYEARMRRRDGEERWISIGVSAIRDADGELVAYHGSLFDVTEARAARERVRLEQQRLEKLLELLPLSVSMSDAMGNLVIGKGTLGEVWGGEVVRGPERFVRYKGWWATDGRPVQLEEWPVLRALRGETRLNDEIEIERFDGERRVIRNWAAPMRDAAGNVAGVVAVNEDVTEKKRAERALAESERRFRALIEHAEDAIVLYDDDLRVVYRSPAAERITGRASRDRLGGRFGIGIHEADREGMRALMHDLRSRPGATVSFRCRRTMPKGAPRWVEGVAVNLLEDPPVRALVVTFRDIDARLRAEESLQRLTRMHATLSALSEAIPRSEDPDGLIQAACDIAVSRGGFIRAAVRLMNPDGKSTRFAGGAGEGVEGLAALTVALDGSVAPGRSLLVDALREGRAAITRDYFNDPRTELARKSPVVRDVRAAGAFPMRHGNKAIGALIVHGADEAALDGEMEQLLQRMADNLAFGLRYLENRAVLRESEALKRGILDASIDGIVTIDASGHIVEFNAAAQSLFGYSREQALGRDMAELVVPPAFREKHRAGLQRLAAGDASAVLDRRIELPAMRADGTTFEAELSIVRNGGTEPPLFTGTVRDITERKRDAALARLEQQLALRFAQATDMGEPLRGAICLICEALQWQAGRYLEVDDARNVLRQRESWSAGDPEVERYLAGSQDLDYAPGQGIAGHVWQTGEPLWVPDISQDPRVRRPQLAAETGMRSSLVCPVHAEGRTLGVFIFDSREIRAPDPRLLRTLGMIGGQVGLLVRRAQAQRALRASEERFRSLLEISSDWYWEQDADLRLTFMSQEQTTRTGLPAATYLGKHRWDEPALNLTQEDWARHRAQLEQREPFKDFEMQRPDGKGGSVWVSLTGEPVFDEQGRFAGYRGVGKDITARKRAEEALRDSEARFRSLSALSSDWFWETDAEHRFVASARHAGLRSSGAEHYEGKAPWEIDGLSPAGGDWTAHRAALERRESFRDLELTQVKPDGMRAYFLVSGEPLHDAHGVFRGYRGTAKDVTERKRDERLLRLEHAVTRELAQAETQSAGIVGLIRLVCESEGWLGGRYWTVDEAAGVARFGESWAPADSVFEAYNDEARSVVFHRGAGYVGRCWESGQPLWTPDVVKDGRALRKASMRAAGKRSSFVVPVSSEGRVLGVLAFDSTQVRAVDARLMEAVRVIGAQAGQFLRRKESEQALRKSEAAFRSLVELSSDWYWEQDQELRFTRFEGPVTERSGNHPSAAIGKRRWEIPSIMPVGGSWDEHRATLEARLPFRGFEYSRIGDDGELRYVEASGEPVFDADGRFRGYRGLATDITARKRAEEARAKTARLYAALSALNELVARAKSREELFRGACEIAVASGDYSYAMARELGEDQIARVVAWAGVQPADWLDEPHDLREGSPHSQTLAAVALRTGRPAVIRDLAEGSDYQRRVAQATGTRGAAAYPILRGGRPFANIFISSREADAFAGEAGQLFERMAQNISHGMDALDAAAAQRASENRFRALIENGADAITVYDPEGRVTYRSPSVGRITGYTDAERIGGRMFALVHEEDLAAMQEMAAGVIARPGASASYRCRSLHKDGRVLWTEGTLTNLLDDPAVGGLVLNYRDITDRVRAEEERERVQRMYAALSAVNELVSRAPSSQALFQGACEIAVSSGDLQFALVRVAEEDKGIAPMVAYAGRAQAPWLNRPLSLDAGAPDAESLALRAWRTGRPVVVTGAELTGRRLFAELTEKTGTRAAAAYPLHRGGRCIGTLLVNSRDPRAFTGEMGDLLERMAISVSQGLDALDAAEAQRRFRLAMDQSADIIALVDRETMRYLDVNDAMCRMLGYTREELLAMHPYDVLPLSREELARSYQALVEDSSRESLLSHYKCKDGSIIPIESARRLIRSGGRDIIVASARDIRSRLAAEEEARRKDAYFRSLIENVSDGIAAVDADWRYLFVSPSMAQLTGYRPEHLLGKRFGETAALGAVDMRERIAEALEKTGKPQTAIVEMRAPGGERRVHELVISRGSGPDGAPIYVIAGRDVTSRIRAEEALRRLTRMHAALTSLSEAVPRTRDARALLQQACEIAAESGDFVRAAVRLLDPETGRTRAAAWSGPGSHELAHFEASIDPGIPEGRTVVAEALRTGKASITRDFLNDPRTLPIRGTPAAVDTRSVGAFPLRQAGQVTGVLILHGRDHYAFDGDMRGLLERMAENISFGLDHLESESRFRQSFELAASGIAHVAPDRRFIRVNRRLCEMLGYSAEELAGLTGHDISHPDDADVINTLRPKLYAGEIDNINVEKRYVRKDGAIIWVAITTSLARHGDGRPAYEISIIEDITRRKRDERLLRLEHAVARILAEAETESAGLQAIIREVCEANEWAAGRFFAPDGDGWLRFREGWGVPAPEVEQYLAHSRQTAYRAGEGLTGLVWEQGEPVWSADVSTDARATGLMRGFHGGAMVLPVTWQGERLGVLSFVRKEPTPPEERLLQGLHVIASQVGQFLQRKRIESERAVLRQRDRSLVEALGEIIYDWRPLTDELVWEGDYRAILGYEDMGRDTASWTSRVHPEDAAAVKAEVEAATRERRNYDLQYRFRHRDGHYLWMHDRGVCSFDAEGRLTRIIGVLADINARKQAEQALRGIVHASAEPLLLVDRDGTTLFANPAAAALFGRSTVELEGAVLGLPLSDGRPADVEIVLPGGGVRPVEMQFAATEIEGREVLVVSLHDLSERRRYEEHIEHLANHDALTGLPNRTLLRDRVEQTIAYARRTQGHVGLMFVDLDQFKLVNDSFGHAAGDMLLLEVAARLKKTVRDGDTVARLGGDEFVVLLPGLAAPGDITVVARKVAEALDHPLDLDGRDLRITASIGISLFPGDGDDLDSLLQCADAAMYRAKDAGRNGYQYYSAEMSTQARARVETEAGLRQALERGELRLHYQPQVVLGTGEVRGFEALMRWERPQGGMVSPAQFIPVAEESGLIVPMGQWALKEACREAMAWSAAGFGAMKIAVNLSARQFWRGSVTEVVRAALGESGLPPTQLELEITESVLARDLKQVMLSLEQLRRMGVAVAIDDFGTGYSSLAYLRSLPISKLKIDKSFIDNIPDDAEASALVAEMVRLAHVLSLEVVAEGVETAEQAAFLRTAGCEAMQGYLFSRPLPGVECATLLKSGRKLALSS